MSGYAVTSRWKFHMCILGDWFAPDVDPLWMDCWVEYGESKHPMPISGFHCALDITDEQAAYGMSILGIPFRPRFAPDVEVVQPHKIA